MSYAPMSSNRYALALHTSSPELGLALSNFSGDSRHATWDLGRSLSTDLHYYLQDFLQPQGWSDLAFLAVAKGPGGFTGTRIGVVTARTLAQQLDIPLFAISSLAAFAYSVGDRLPLETKGTGSASTVDIAVQMPAQRGELFAAIYGTHAITPTPSSEPRLDSSSEPSSDPGQQPNPVPTPAWTALFPDAVLTPEQWQQTLEQWQRPYRLLHADSNLGDSVTSLLHLAYQEWCSNLRPLWSEALPFYGQHPVV